MNQDINLRSLFSLTKNYDRETLDKILTLLYQLRADQRLFSVMEGEYFRYYYHASLDAIFFNVKESFNQEEHIIYPPEQEIYYNDIPLQHYLAVQSDVLPIVTLIIINAKSEEKEMELTFTEVENRFHLAPIPTLDDEHDYYYFRNETRKGSFYHLLRLATK